MTTGLCASCVHGESIASSRGSTFLLCGRSRFDPAFPKYPRLPVLACAGFADRPPRGQEGVSGRRAEGVEPTPKR